MKIIVSYGGGTNSTAMLIGLKERGVTPDAITFADTGGEKPYTYEHINQVNNWCISSGFPEITILKGSMPQQINDGTLENECLRLGTLPSKAYGYSSCADKWKMNPQRKYDKEFASINGISLREIVRMIGARACAHNAAMPKAPPSGSPHPAAVAGGVAAVVVGLALLAARDRPVFSPPPTSPDEITEAATGAPPSQSTVASTRRPVAPVRVIRRPPLTNAQRDKGLNECATPDPGEGSLRPKKLFPWGVIQLPRSGGHTGDYGYDVVIHFHGAEGARKALAPLGTGLVLVGVDRGEGSGSYDQIFPLPATFEAFRKAITGMLLAETKQPEAHIRRLALSSWSTGYGATVSILRNAGDADVDLVVFLDSLHAGYTSNGGGSTAGVSVAENTTAVTTVAATDPDGAAQTLTYSLAGGADQAKFQINGSTGALSFLVGPNFEAPTMPTATTSTK